MMKNVLKPAAAAMAVAALIAGTTLVSCLLYTSDAADEL